MASGEGNSAGRAPFFDGSNYSFWKIRMQSFLSSLMRDVWNIVKKGYTGSDDPTYPNEKKLYEYDAKARNALMNGLSDAELVKVMSCTSAKEIWDKLQGVYEGDKKIKEAKLQTYRTQFENIKMTENENVGAYLQRVNEVVTSIRGLGETLKDQVAVKKVLRSLPYRFDPKVSAIEEAKDLDVFSMDELQGSLIAFEMRIGKPKSIDREAAFNVYRKSMKDNSDDEEDEETANLVLHAEVGCEALFMVMFDEVKEPEISDKEEEEPKVNLEGELVVALEELTVETKKHKKTAKKLEEAESLLMSAKGEMEEDKQIIEELEAQVVLKIEECSKLEEQVTILHAQVDELSQKIKVYQGSSKLDDLLNMQRPCHIKFGLGYEHGETSTKPAEDKVKKMQ
ncbi:hypothetical protein MRB53_006460 [Persea americana]|uniref:Uncharacterized protein n=1 Tax=Persea americana TaxID=3435 RepID=A0ACC2MG28_PERAE|nr:hypothetical protein MRB53_006460 [Persea americana]